MLAFTLGGSSSIYCRPFHDAELFATDSLNIITKQNRFVKQKTEFAKEIKNIFRFRSSHNFADAHAQKGRQYAEHKIFGHIEQIIRDRGLPDGAVIHVKTPY